MGKPEKTPQIVFRILNSIPYLAVPSVRETTSKVLTVPA